MILLIDIFDRVGASQQHNSVIGVLYNDTFLETFRQIMFLSHDGTALYFDTGSEKLNNIIL